MLWALTTYFNPFGCEHRRRNFREFRKATPVPLMVVEIATDENCFELDEYGAAEEVVQIVGGCMWQKERALNVGLRQLPPDCDKVITVDCDVVFPASGAWLQMDEKLDEHPIIQPFRYVDYIGQDGGIDRAWLSVSYCGGRPFAALDPVSHGIAWGFRRNLIERFKFYDRFVVGGGDVALSAAVWGRAEIVPPRFAMNQARQDHYEDWANEFPDMGAKHVATVAKHLWHGSIASRGYQSRKPILHTFDPGADVVPGYSADTGWHDGLFWADTLQATVLQRQVEAYMESRMQAAKEEGLSI